jgi:uridine kinase
MFTSASEIIQKVKAVTKRPYLIGIDGRSGAGKSALSRKFREHLTDAVVIHNDDFYRVMEEEERATLDAEQGYYRYFDWERLKQQVLLPLAAQQRARYQRYDWGKEELAEIMEVSPSGVTIVEGVYSTRPELREYYDLTIWVETSDTERLRRQLAREGNTDEWIQRWAAAEALYVEDFRPIRSAHITVAGE